MTGYLPDAKIEAMAGQLLARYEELHGAITAPPVPVERVVEDVLDLGILWERVDEPPGVTVLAALVPRERVILLNETRRELIGETAGLYSTILGHEAGHWEMHVDKGVLQQAGFPGLEPPDGCLYRPDEPKNDPRETQAHRFMGYLLMPSALVRDAAEGMDLMQWPELYRLRDLFQVTISVLTIRLAQLGRLYVGPDGTLHRSRAEYRGQRRLTEPLP